MQTAATVGALPAARNGVPIGDLFALADAVAAMVGGATTIEDPGSRVLAYSSLDHPIDVPRQEAILGRRVPANWMRRLNDEGIFRRLWQEDAVIHVHLDIAGLRPRLAVAVRAGGQVLGSIWVIEGEKPFAPEAEAGLKEAAELAAIHLLRHSSSEDIERRHRSEALRALLEGHGSPERGAAILRIGLETPVAVVSLVPVTAADAEAEVQAQRAADLVALYCESYRRRAACVAIGGAVYVLLPEVGQDGRERLVALIETLVQRAHESLRIRLRSGVGSTVAGLAQVAGSRREADQAARALIDDPRGRTVADIDQVRSRVILRELADVAARAPALRAGPLAALATHDAERGTAYVATLGAYLDAFGDVALAATAVNVHPNTFRYRLRRLTEISGLDLDDPDARLVAQLQLRFLAHG
jgi:sugar diacid utilization regulator